ncbi:MAG: hypothetical protein ACI808_002672, partial [Paraglaciecola sp.]
FDGIGSRQICKKLNLNEDSLKFLLTCRTQVQGY